MFGLLEVVSPDPILCFYPSWQMNNCTSVSLNPRKKDCCSETYIQILQKIKKSKYHILYSAETSVDI